MKSRLVVLKWGIVLALIACKREKKDAAADMGHAAVTTVEVLLVQGSDTVRGRYKDPDGPGGRPATIDTLRPQANASYTYTLRVLDESGNPPQDLSNIVFNEQKNTHRMYFFPDPEGLATIEPQDTDDLGRLVGGRGTWRQGPDTLREGTVRFLLRHYMSAADKNLGLERGSTDLDVKLPVRIRD